MVSEGVFTWIMVCISFFFYWNEKSVFKRERKFFIKKEKKGKQKSKKINNVWQLQTIKRLNKVFKVVIFVYLLTFISPS